MSRKIMFLYFVDGFLYTFGLSKNPVNRIKDEYNKSTDFDAISSDWRRVGTDLNNAFNESKETCKG